MRISDWISDVCSSDLVRRAHADAAAIRLGQPHDEPRHRGLAGAGLANQAERLALVDGEADIFRRLDAPGRPQPARSEERRVGIEGVSTCSARGSRINRKKHKKNSKTKQNT